MSILAIYPESGGKPGQIIRENDKIAQTLNQIGVLFETWNTNVIITDSATQDEILKAYEKEVTKLKNQYHFQSSDVVSLNPNHPDRESLRQKFLPEHTHTDYEIRFFIDGTGLFYLHVKNMVYVLFCIKGDLISVPANTPHWFDMGKKPSFKCIRMFTDTTGWVGHSTGNNISTLFPDYDTFVEEFS